MFPPEPEGDSPDLLGGGGGGGGGLTIVGFGLPVTPSIARSFPRAGAGAGWRSFLVILTFLRIRLVRRDDAHELDEFHGPRWDDHPLDSFESKWLVVRSAA